MPTFQRFPQPFNFPSHWTGRGFKSKHLLMASYPHKTKKAGHQRPSAPPASRYSLVFKAFSYAKLKSPQPIVSSTEDFRGRSAGIRTRGLLDPKIRLKRQGALSAPFGAVCSRKRCFPNLSAPMPPSAPDMVWITVLVKP